MTVATLVATPDPSKGTKVKPTCQRCGKPIAKGPGRCSGCLGKALRPTSPASWQRRDYHRNPADEE
jgi:predicted amidophosphoribosyltransferase